MQSSAATKDPVSAIVERSGLLQPGQCLACQVCCRFGSPASPMAPYFSQSEMDEARNTGAFPADAFPPGDVAVLNALGLGRGARDVREADARSQAWRPWRSYAVLKLWNSLEKSP